VAQPLSLKFVGQRLDFHWYPDPNIVADQLEETATKLNTTLDVPLNESIPIVIEDVRGHFEDEGPGWEPWGRFGAQGPREKYARTYTEHGPSLLQLGGDLFSHATSEGSYHVVGNTVQYIPSDLDELFHTHGPYKRNIYAREYIGLEPSGEEVVVRIFADWMEGMIRGVAGGAPPPSSGGSTSRFTRGGVTYEQPRSSLGTFLPGRRRV
jgi:phage gpG-like protein